MAGRKRTRRRGKGEGTVYQRKDGTWETKVSLGYDAEGRRKRRSLYGKTEGEVLEKQRQIRQQLAEGTYGETDLTVKGYLERWLPAKARTVKPLTAQLHRYSSEKYIIPRLGGVKLGKMGALRVQDAILDIADTAGVRTANIARGVLHQAMEQAVEWQLVARNVVKGVKKLKETPKEQQIWTFEQAARFLDSVRGHRLYAAFYLAMSTGMRRGEVLGLRWQDVQAGAVNVKQALEPVSGGIAFGTPKTANGLRRVEITPDVGDVLEAHRQRQQAEREALGDMWPCSNLVFTSKVGTPVYPCNFNRSWSAVCKAAGVPYMRLHNLRHLSVSLGVKNGADPAWIARQTGDSVRVVLSVYAHLFEAQRKSSAVSLAELLRGPDKPN